MALTICFRLPPGPQSLDYAVLAERLGYDRIWSPEVPAFGHDIWVHLARVAERTERIGIGPAVLIPSYRHPVAQASAIASVEQIAPGRLMAGLGQKPLAWSAMRRHILQVRALLRGEPVEVDGGMTQLLASPGWLPGRPILTPLLVAAQGPKGRAVAKEVGDGLIALGSPGHGFDPCFVSVNGTVLDDGEAADSPRAQAAVAPLIAAAYHSVYSRDPEAVRRLPNGDAWLESVQRVPEPVRHLSVHRGHNLDISNEHDELIDTTRTREMTFTGTVAELRQRVAALESAGATGIIFGTSGMDVERELHMYRKVVSDE
jgi:5,10-methylenetetrahydromethanopterin reductase